MTDQIKEHTGISPENFPRFFVAKHFAPYIFATKYAKGLSVLEVGFGDGYGSSFLAEHAKTVTAIDKFPTNAQKAAEKYRKNNLTFTAMDALDMSFPDNSFDVIICFQVIEHFPPEYYPGFFARVKSILKKGGLFIVTTPNLLNLRKNKYYEKNVHHFTEFTHETFGELIKKFFDAFTLYSVDHSAKCKFYLRLKKSGIFKCFPSGINPVKRYFDNFPDEGFVVSNKVLEKAPDILAVIKN